MFGVATLVLALFLPNGSAFAAIVPFNPGQPTVFIAQGSPTQLEAATQSGGAITFTPVGGTVSGLTYNAIGYDTCNNFIYGVQTSTANGQSIGAVIQIAGDGSITYPGINVGTANVGAFGPDANCDDFYVGNSGSSTLTKVNLLTKTSTTINVGGAVAAPRHVLQQRVLLVDGCSQPDPTDQRHGGPAGRDDVHERLDSGGGELDPERRVRRGVDLRQRQRRVLEQHLGQHLPDRDRERRLELADVHDGAQSGRAGELEQRRDQRPGFEHRSGADEVGELVDGRSRWRDHVHADRYQQRPGQVFGVCADGHASPGVTNAVTTTPGCRVTAPGVVCAGAPLANGSSSIVTITVNAPNPFASPITNTATVTANESDPNAANNTASATVKPNVVTVALVKSATVTPPSDQQAAEVGDTIQYSYNVTNTGNVPLTSVAASDPTAGSVACPVPAAPGLAPGASETCVARTPYLVKQTDVDIGSVIDTATATGTDATGFTSSPSAPSSTTVPTVQAMPSLVLQKVADASLGDGAPIQAGETIRYSYVLTNTGNVDLTTLSVSDPNRWRGHVPDATGPGTGPRRHADVHGEHPVRRHPGRRRQGWGDRHGDGHRHRPARRQRNLAPGDGLDLVAPEPSAAPLTTGSTTPWPSPLPTNARHSASRTCARR